MHTMKSYAVALSVIAAVWGVVAGPANAADRWWDGGATNLPANGDGASQGGAGTWNTTTNNWDQGNALPHTNWINANNDNAIFGGTAGTVTNTEPVTVGGMVFTSPYTVVASGGMLTFGIPSTVSNSAAVTISAVLAGNGFTKLGTNTLTLNNNANQFTGSTIISAGKISLGQQYALWKSPYDTTGSDGSTIGLDLGTVSSPVLGGLAGSVNLASAITTGHNAVTNLTLNPQTGTSVSYAGVIANGTASRNLIKTGPGTQTLTGNNTYSGGTTNYAGTLALAGASGAIISTSVTVYGGTLSLDNSGGTWVNRIPDAATLRLGSLTLTSCDGAGVTNETVGATTFGTSGKITVNNGTTPGDQTTLALGAVTRSAGAAIDFVGNNGTLGGGLNSPNVTSTGSWPGATNGILPWATVGGTNWAITNANGIVAYSGAFVDPTVAASAAMSNAQLTGSGTMGSAKSFNSLNVIASGAGQSLTLGGILTLATNAILKSGTDAYTITSSVANAITAGSELIAHVDGGDLTISAPLNTAVLGVAKGGTGKLILSGTRAGTMSGAISIAGGLEFQGASTILSGGVTGPGGLTVNLNPGQKLNLQGANTYSGQTLVKGGILEIGTGYTMTGIFPGVPGSSIASTGQGLLGNLELNGGILAIRYYMGEFLGAGPGQFQITGGTSGIANYQGDAASSIWTINNDANYEVVWGSTYFKPDVLALSDSTMTASSAFTFTQIPNRFDLNGATRTIIVASNPNATPYAANTHLGGVLSGVIRDSSGGSAGLIKTGIGVLELRGANTFTGPITVNGGVLLVTSIANGGVANPLGMSSAASANLLLANGTSLRYTGGAASSDRSFTLNGTANGDSATLNASGTGALVLNNTATPGYGTSGQMRTLILGGTSTFTNTLAASLTDNGGATVSVTKTNTGVWVLTGNNTYTGPTTLSGGDLGVSDAANLGAASANLVFDGGTLQIVGTGLTSLSALGRTVVANPGVTVGLNIANAANTFTMDQVLTGSVSFAKSGAGTLLFNLANTYSGQTTINGGVLQYNNGATIPTTPLLNNAALVVNRTDTLTQGSNFHSIMGGTGTVTMANSGTLALNNLNSYSGATKANAGTIALSHPLALMNSPIDTTGASGVFTLSGITNLTIGGLTQSGAPRDLIWVITTGYGSVTNLILNTSNTVTYGGAIADGASGMAVTMAGAGTQILTNTSTYSGATILKAGTLTLSGASGALTNTSGLTMNGGTLNLVNTSTANNTDRVPSSTITSASGGTIQFNNTAAAVNYAETLGSITLGGGQLNVYTVNNNNSGQTQVLTFGGSLANSTTAAIAFSGASLGVANRNQINVSGQGNTAANQIIGPWALYGSAPATLTDYAVYNITAGAANSLGIQPANLATNNTESTWPTTWSASGNIVESTVTSLSATRSLNSLRYTGAGATLALGANNLETYGLLNGGTGGLTVSGTGALTTPSGGGNLFITPGNNTITVSAPINNNGGNVTLVKNGSGGLTLSSTSTSDYSGGTVLNGGTLTTSTNANLGNISGGITVNGTVTWDWQTANTTYDRNLTVNEGAILSITPHSAGARSVTGVVSGNGTLYASDATYFPGTGNTFSGTLNIGYSMSFGSIGDSSNPINLPNTSFIWTGGAKTFVLRPFILSATGGGAIYSSGTAALTIQQPAIITGAAGARTLTLGGSYGTTANTFAGNITDGPGSVVSFTKSADASIWALSGTNTYSGATTPSANTGTVGPLVFQGMQALSPLTWLISGNNPSDGGKVPATIKILDDSATPASRSGVNVFMSNGNAQEAMTVFVGNNSVANGGTSAGTQSGSTIQLGNMNFSVASGAPTSAGNKLSVTGANGYRLQIANVNVTLQPSYTSTWNTMLNPTTAPLTVAGNVQQMAGGGGTVNLQLDGTATGNLISGTIMNSADVTPKALALTKQNTSEWILSGANTHTGTNTLNAGTLVFSNATALGSGTITFTGTGGTLKYGTGFTTDLSSRIKSSTGPVTIDPNSQTVTYASPIDNSNSAGLTMAGTGILTLSGANAFTGANTVQNGKLKADASNNLVFSGNNALTFNTAGGTFEYDNGTTGSGRAQTLGALTFTLGDGTVQLTKTASPDLKLTFASLAVRGAGGTGNFVWSGTTDGNNGIYFTTVTAGFQNQGEFFNGSNYAYMLANSYVRGINYGTDANTVSLGAGTEIGSGDANKHVKLTGAMSGQTTRPILTLNIAGAYDFTLASGTVTLSNGGILKAGGGTSVISGGTAITTASGVEYVFRTDTASDTLTINTPITANGANALTKSGAGTLVLGGANTFTGNTYVNQGILRLTNNAAAGTAASTISVLNGAALELSGGINISNKTITTTGTGIAGNGVVRNISGNNTYGGAVTLGAGGARINSDSGTLTFTNTITTAIGKDLTVGGAGNVTISGIISGAGGVIKDGNGTLTLTTNNTYTGATMINAGTLAGVTGGSCSNSAVTVASAGTLQVLVTDSAKQWTCASLALNNGSQVRYTFSVAPSTNLAPLNVLGNLTFSGTPTIVVDKSKVAAGQIYPLLVVGGTAPAALPALGGSVAGKLAWGGPGNKTLYLTTSTGMVLILE